jgi:probable H4MPT-linked C1 transfer pathway protein
MPPAILGLDIGGANLKAAHSSGLVILRPFELWKRPGDLRQTLTGLLDEFPPAELLAVTMTGELCDCFDTKRQGVHAILDAVAAAAGRTPVWVWRTEGGFAGVRAAQAAPLLVASANWHALATFAGRFLPSGTGVVLDVGSTTTDIVPLADGRPVPRGLTDPQRLACQELVYTGATRTPVCALLGSGGAAEWFATMLDVYLILGLIDEDASNDRTADGRPAMRAAAYSRLARMLCADAATINHARVTSLARQLCKAQTLLIRGALQRVARVSCHQPYPWVLLSGSGEFVGRLALDLAPEYPSDHVISLSTALGAPAARAACAYAVCRLAEEQTGQ